MQFPTATESYGLHEGAVAIITKLGSAIACFPVTGADFPTCLGTMMPSFNTTRLEINPLILAGKMQQNGSLYARGEISCVTIR